MEFPRILIISHTAFTKADSMGSTLASYFTSYDPDCIAQFYIKEMTPDIPVCRRYYCVTDRELVRKLLRPITGKVGTAVELAEDESSAPGKSAESSQIGGHRHRDAALLARKLIWSTRLWNNKRFKDWIRSVDPQVILVQPGDFSYLLDMGVYLAGELQIPIVVHQSETYYLKEYEKRTALYKLFRYDFKKSYERLMKHTAYCIYLCEKIEEGYRRYFDIPAETIMKATNIRPQKSERMFDRQNIRFIYGGNLGETVGRCEPLVEMGKIIRKLGSHIDVYSSSTGSHLAALTPENGIVFHGAISYEQLQKEIKDSDFVLHIESQKPWNVKDLEFAFSTKIADMLASGVCPVVYGCDKIASIKYFKDHDLGCVIEKKEDIELKLREVIDNGELRTRYIANALSQAECEHDSGKNSERMRDIICTVCNNTKASPVEKSARTQRNVEK